MNSSDNLMNFIILAAIVCFVIRTLFSNKSPYSCQNRKVRYASGPVPYEPFKMDLNDDDVVEGMEGALPPNPPANRSPDNRSQPLSIDEEAYNLNLDLDSESLRDIMTESTGSVESVPVLRNQKPSSKPDLLTKPDGTGEGYYGCPNSKSKKELEIYRWDNLLGRDRLGPCDNASQSAKDAMCQHVDFRNGVNQDSHLEDTVDRISRLYLEGNTDIARGHRGMAIGDLFDGLTRGNERVTGERPGGTGPGVANLGSTLYDRTCVRLPDLDSKLNSNFYDYNGNAGYSLQGVAWHDTPSHKLNSGMPGQDYHMNPHLPVSEIGM